MEQRLLDIGQRAADCQTAGMCHDVHALAE